MPTIERIEKENEVVMRVRISKGYIDGKRLRKRYNMTLSKDEYPTEESQYERFNQYLEENGERRIDYIDDPHLENNLNSKIPDKEIKLKKSKRKIVMIPLECLYEFKDNPSHPSLEFIERLAANIHEDGLNNPIRVVKFGNKYYIESGNKRYAAYKLLAEKYGSQYDYIESYVVDYEMNEEDGVDPVFALKLMRDNINHYERTIYDKMREVALYHRIFPALKERLKIVGRENEYIAAEMGISDKSVKDYLKIIKNGLIYSGFLNDEFDSLMTALQMVDYYNDYGKDECCKAMERIKNRNGMVDNEKRKISYSDIGYEFYLKKIEDAGKKRNEIKEKNEEGSSTSQKLSTDNNNDSVITNENKGKQKEVKCIKSFDELPDMTFAFKKLKAFELNLTENRYSLDFIICDQIDGNSYYFLLKAYREGCEVYLSNCNDYMNHPYMSIYNPDKVLVKYEHKNEKESAINVFYVLRNIEQLGLTSTIILDLAGEEGFVARLLANIYVELKDD